MCMLGVERAWCERVDSDVVARRKLTGKRQASCGVWGASTIEGLGLSYWEGCPLPPINNLFSNCISCFPRVNKDPDNCKVLEIPIASFPADCRSRRNDHQVSLYTYKLVKENGFHAWSLHLNEILERHTDKRVEERSPSPVMRWLVSAPFPPFSLPLNP